MDHTKLRALIDSDPANDPPATDAAVLTWLKENVTVKNDVTWTNYMIWLFDTDGVQKLETAKVAGASDAIKNAAWLALIVANAGKDLTLSRDDVRAAMTPLIGPVFTVAEKDALLAKSDEPKPRWQANGFASIDDASWVVHINIARAL